MSNTNSHILRSHISKRVVLETGLSGPTVDKYIRIIETPAFLRIAKAYIQAIQEQTKTIEQLEKIEQ